MIEGFDPYAFAEKWYEEHPEALKGFDMVEKMKGSTNENSEDDE